MQFKRQSLEPADVNITPLIDVVFLLLIFFMVSTTFPNQQISLNLPTASTAEPQRDPLPQVSVLSLFADGRILFNEQEQTSLKALEAELAQQPALEALLIQAESTTEHQQLVSALDLARRLGVEKVRLATQPL
ncbi:ExbD/TolR family protein [Marinospirillum minutulum]|uniref:ExbD/TolR family protein n=1 Tax=Marinospirillum minutulum TaxID=64974 RepID=UPI0003F5A16B|nr:biopolymer transporter ExbD [Marinospirillum minutulum]